MRRIEPDEPAAALLAPFTPASAEPVVPAVAEPDGDAPALPHDHPHWVRDAVAVSQRARELLAKLRPVIVRVFSFWDHRVRSAIVAGRRIHVDVSGCYRTGG